MGATSSTCLCGTRKAPGQVPPARIGWPGSVRRAPQPLHHGVGTAGQLGPRDQRPKSDVPRGDQRRVRSCWASQLRRYRIDSGTRKMKAPRKKIPPVGLRTTSSPRPPKEPPRVQADDCGECGPHHDSRDARVSGVRLHRCPARRRGEAACPMSKIRIARQVLPVGAQHSEPAADQGKECQGQCAEKRRATIEQAMGSTLCSPMPGRR